MFFKKKGESIIEVLIAIVILTIVMTAAFKTLTTVTSSNINVKNRIMALNIAREGIEAVRNIRDTNWIKYSGDLDTKWLCHDTLASPNNCLGASVNKLVDGFYSVDFSNISNRYLLTLINHGTSYRLNLSGPSSGIENFRLFKKTNKKLTHDDNGGANEKSPFYRQIEIVIPTGINICSDPSNNNCTEDKIEIISRVQWKEGAQVKKAVLETHLFNFYKRSSY